MKNTKKNGLSGWLHFDLDFPNTVCSDIYTGCWPQVWTDWQCGSESVERRANCELPGSLVGNMASSVLNCVLYFFRVLLKVRIFKNILIDESFNNYQTTHRHALYIYILLYLHGFITQQQQHRDQSQEITCQPFCVIIMVHHLPDGKTKSWTRNRKKLRKLK